MSATTHHVDDRRLIDGPATVAVIQEVLNERIRQDDKWGQQNHPDGTGPTSTPLFSREAFLDDTMWAARLAEIFTQRTDARFSGTGEQPGTWADILLEEVFEALAESDPAKLRTELVQVAAVAAGWAEAIDRRQREVSA